MKIPTPSSVLPRCGAVALLALAIASGVLLLRAAEKPAAPSAAPGALAHDMMGAWVHVGEPGDVGPIPAKGGRFKFRTGNHWVLVHAKPGTRTVVEAFGGTYRLEGSTYIESIDYGADDDEDVGKTFRFTVKVEGDTMTQIGIDNPWHEVWKRAR